jgi:hypothetical protein
MQNLGVATGLLLVVACGACGSGGHEPVDTEALINHAIAGRGCEIVARDHRMLTLACTGGLKTAADLAPLDHDLALAPSDSERRRLIDAFAASLGTIDEVKDSAKDWRGHVLPTLKSLAYVQNVLPSLPPDQQKDNTVPYRLLAPEITEVIMLDTASGMALVTQKQADAWKAEGAEVVAVAMHNLDLITTDLDKHLIVDKTATGQPRVTVQFGDNYDAARLLLPSVRAAVDKALGGKAAWGIPDRDHLIAVRLDDAAAVAALRHEVGTSAGPYAISALVIQVDDAGHFSLVM